MPRPVSNLEPVVIEAPISIGSSSLSAMTSPPADSAWGVPINQSNNQSIHQLTAWGLQWDSIDDTVYDKEEGLNLSMSVPRRQHRNIDFDSDEQIQNENDQQLSDNESINQSVGGFIDQAMKEDGFVPLNESITERGREIRANESTTNAPFVTITTAQSSNNQSINQPNNQSTNEEFCCPCCGLSTAGGIAYHEHVTQCYINRFMQSHQSTNNPSNNQISNQSINQTHNPSHHQDSSNNPSSISTLRNAVSNLDLHERIGLMEAFFRLSRSAASPTAATSTANQAGAQPMVQDNQPVNPSVGDEAVISLLFSPTQADEPPAPTSTIDQQAPSVANQSLTVLSYRGSPSLSSTSVNQPNTPLRSPSLSPNINHSLGGHSLNQHTCLTPALHRWELDGKEDEIQAFSLIDCADSDRLVDSHQLSRLMDHSGHDRGYLSLTNDSLTQPLNQSAPSSPASAYKRARALSQPHVMYNDDMQVRPSFVRSYSPLQVHVQPPQSISQTLNPAWTLGASELGHAARRHSVGFDRKQQVGHNKSRDFVTSAVDGLTFNAGIVNSPPSTQSSPIHHSITHPPHPHRLHQYMPIVSQQYPKHKRGNPDFRNSA